MSEKYLTAVECLNQFKRVGLNVSKAAFSKQVKKGLYTTYEGGNNKKDLYIWDEVLTDYLKFTFPKDQEEEQLRKDIFENVKIEKQIEEQLNFVFNFETLNFEMFEKESLNTFFEEAQSDLEEMNTKIKQGKKIDPFTKKYILKEASKTKEDFIKEFKIDIENVNSINLNTQNIGLDLCEELNKIYPTFENSKLKYYILKFFAKNIDLLNCKNFADEWGVKLINVKKEEV